MKIFGLHLYQLVVAVLAIAMIYQGLIRYIRRESSQTFLKFLVRFVIWGGMIIVTLFPDVTNWFAKVIGLQGNINAVILTGFLFVFLITFKLLSSIERLEKQISILTRQDALENIDEDHNNSKNNR